MAGDAAYVRADNRADAAMMGKGAAKHGADRYARNCTGCAATLRVMAVMVRVVVARMVRRTRLRDGRHGRGQQQAAALALANCLNMVLSSAWKRTGEERKRGANGVRVKVAGTRTKL